MPTPTSLEGTEISGMETPTICMYSFYIVSFPADNINSFRSVRNFVIDLRR